MGDVAVSSSRITRTYSTTDPLAANSVMTFLSSGLGCALLCFKASKSVVRVGTTPKSAHLRHLGHLTARCPVIINSNPDFPIGQDCRLGPWAVRATLIMRAGGQNKGRSRLVTTSNMYRHTSQTPESPDFAMADMQQSLLHQVHDANVDGPSLSTTPPTESDQNVRKTAACLSCRNIKIKCVRGEGATACTRCLNKGTRCTIPEYRVGRRKGVPKYVSLLLLLLLLLFGILLRVLYLLHPTNPPICNNRPVVSLAPNAWGASQHSPLVLPQSFD